MQMNTRIWYIDARDFGIGPYDQSSVVAAIQSGALMRGNCRRYGERRWRRLGDVPAFAMAFRCFAELGPLEACASPNDGALSTGCSPDPTGAQTALDDTVPA